ncbi:hypothetical protein KX729_09135 [Rhizobium sp. XQZ8]|uniref:hypothetical protein n=1 Tax=Rhizobium populisoli TaxID=2859785 RepID=UPI001CA4817E|nr:hypothetical protein [Rhizobium populisoli]MBW6421602.1 hypothetical protein [Rhizobium populisoli]
MADYSASSWNEVDASNTSASPDGLPTGAQPSALAPRLRAMAGAAKRSWDRINAATTSTGTATASILTYSQGPALYFKGERFAFWANATNTGALTININALGAKSILRPNGTALVAGDITNGTFTEIVYDGTNFRIVNSVQASPTFTGTVTAPTFSGAFSGSGAAITGLNASQLTTGTLPNAVLSGAYNGITNLGMAGTLTNVTNSEALRLQAATTGNDPFISFYEADGTTRRAYIQHRDGAGNGNGIRLTTDATGDFLNLTNDNTTSALVLFDSSVGAYYKVWHEGNDGAGSTLEADTVDGYHATGLFRNNADFSTSGNLTITNSAPYIVLSDTTSGSYNTRIVVDANNWLLQKQADGSTTWTTFMQFEMDTTNAYANGSQIWTNDNVTASSLTTKLGYTPANRAIVLTAGNGLTGGGGIDTNRTFTLGTPTAITASSTNSVTATSHTHDFDVASFIYTGSSSSNVTFPLGTYIAVYSGYIDLAASATVRLGTSGDFYTTGSGAVVTGTWRTRGAVGQDRMLFQRVS